MRFLTNINATDYCQTTTNERLIYFPTNSDKLQNYLGSSKIWFMKSALLGKIHALLQDVVYVQYGMVIWCILLIYKCITGHKTVSHQLMTGPGSRENNRKDPRATVAD